jgi:hypothetical protein
VLGVSAAVQRDEHRTLDRAEDGHALAGSPFLDALRLLAPALGAGQRQVRLVFVGAVQ